MKRAYLFIHDTQLTRATRFYKLWLGQSERDARIYRTLCALPLVSTDYFFARWSDEVCTFIDRVAHSLTCNIAQLIDTAHTARQIVDALPTAHVENLSTCHLLNTINHANSR